ncbi:MAG: hypothetical protein IJP74_07545 [Prevotella sp.]|nr:hypothetical protein [Prevotella sp.]
MKKLYATIMFAMMAMTSMAQELNDTTYVMFDFNLNPWNHPVSTAEKGWGPDYGDLTGAILKNTDFTWPIAEGSDKLVTVTLYPPTDWDEFNPERPSLLCRRTCVNAGIYTADGGDSILTMLFTNPGYTMRFKAPEGYKFGKMLFHDYRSNYFLIDTEEEIEVERLGSTHKDTHKIWIPETPKVNKNNLDCWEGDETNILFNNQAYFKGNFMKIDMRLVPNGNAGVVEIADKDTEGNQLYDLLGRRAGATPHKGVYISGGRKIVK